MDQQLNVLDLSKNDREMQGSGFKPRLDVYIKFEVKFVVKLLLQDEKWKITCLILGRKM